MSSPPPDTWFPKSIQPVGGAIRQRRENLGLTQAQLAERIGPDTTPRDIERIESGHIVFPSWLRLLRIAEALDCSSAELLAMVSSDDRQP